MSLSLDFETRSAFNLRAGGVYPYAEHPSTEILLFAWAIDDAPVQLWHEGDFFPDEVAEHIAAGREMRAWNCQFERVLWRVGLRRYGFPACPDYLWRDTAAEAAAMALPRGLDQAAEVLRTKFQKDKEGHALMLKMCKPRAPRKDEDPNGLYWYDSSADRQRLGAYCGTDVDTERAVAKAVRRLGANEERIFLLDQVINDRGVRIDRPLIHAAQGIADTGLKHAVKTLKRLTLGTVEGPTKLNDMKAWLAGQGVTAHSLAKKPLADLLDSELPDVVREVLEVRADAAKSSVAKLKSMLDFACADDRMRGMLLYHGAATGRWSGKGPQPHNFPRPTMEAEAYIDLVLAGEYETLDTIAPPLDIISSMLRSCLIASPGHRLIAADYSGIEARITNWFAGQWDIVQKFARNEDVYMYNAIRMFNLPASANKKTHAHERQGGKATELGCGFGMGPAKFQTSAEDVYGLTITLEEAKEYVKFYRDSHPQVVQVWRDLNDAAKAAVHEPGSTHWVGVGAKVAFSMRGRFLYLMLPSKRPLCYARPRIETREAPWSTPENPKYVESVVAWGVDSLTRRWSEFHLYGGMLMENIAQAMARDFMGEGMLRCEPQGYPIILTVHDEIVADVPDGRGSVREFEALLSALPPWALGGDSGVPCPIAAEGWEGQRYRK